MKEIRAARGLAPYAEGQVDAYLREKAAILDERHVVREIPVAPALWRDFIWMTPLCQDLNEKEKQAMAQRAQSAVTIDLHVAAVRL